jgi:hypothetical protein
MKQSHFPKPDAYIDPKPFKPMTEEERAERKRRWETETREFEDYINKLAAEGKLEWPQTTAK